MSIKEYNYCKECGRQISKKLERCYECYRKKVGQSKFRYKDEE